MYIFLSTDGAVVSRETEREGDSAGQETFVGVREMEEWDDDSSTSGESHHSSDMDLSDTTETEGQLFLEVGTLDLIGLIALLRFLDVVDSVRKICKAKVLESLRLQLKICKTAIITSSYYMGQLVLI